MRKLIVILLTLSLALGGLVAFAGCSDTAAEPCDHVYSGRGTQADPYLIADEEDFRHIKCESYNASGVYFRMTADLRFGNADPFEPVATFRGVLDGAGHSFSLTYAYANPIMCRVAVFGTLRGATVQNIDFLVNLEGTGVLYTTVAGIALDVEDGSVISGCTVSGSINAIGGQAYAAGLVGTVTDGRVIGCASTAEVYAETTGNVIVNENAENQGKAAASGLFSVLNGSAESCYFAGTLEVKQNVSEESYNPDYVYALIKSGVASKFYQRENATNEAVLLRCYYLADSAEQGVSETGEGLTAQAEARTDAELRSAAFVQALNADGNYFIAIEGGYPVPFRG